MSMTEYVDGSDKELEKLKFGICVGHAWEVADLLHNNDNIENEDMEDVDAYTDNKITIFINRERLYLEITIHGYGDNKIDKVVLEQDSIGYVEQFHKGKWMDYIEEILWPMVVKYKEDKANEEKLRQQKDHDGLFGPIDDSSIFGKENT